MFAAEAPARPVIGEDFGVVGYDELRPAPPDHDTTPSGEHAPLDMHCSYDGNCRSWVDGSRKPQGFRQARLVLGQAPELASGAARWRFDAACPLPVVP